MKQVSLIALFGLILLALPARSQYVTKYPEIPRIDVHTHPANHYDVIRSFLAGRELLLSECKADVAMWINLGSISGGETAIDTINEVSHGRIASCISDYTPHKGLTHKPEDMAGYLKKGYVGYKIWHGTVEQLVSEGTYQEGDPDIRYLYLDDPHHEPVIAAMEKTGMVMASVHIADPNGPFSNRKLCEGCFCPDPVIFWRSMMGLERVLQRHPNLVVVAAHGCWLMVQDAQLDFLRYLFKTYPNFYTDIAATGFFTDVSRDNIRDLFVEYSDHLLFGTDLSWTGSMDPGDFARTNNYLFRCLETADELPDFPLKKGLDLPEEILENIYYRNALKVYPGLAERMQRLGYRIPAR
jgi:hypothetical protein